MYINSSDKIIIIYTYFIFCKLLNSWGSAYSKSENSIGLLSSFLLSIEEKVTERYCRLKIANPIIRPINLKYSIWVGSITLKSVLISNSYERSWEYLKSECFGFPISLDIR